MYYRQKRLSRSKLEFSKTVRKSLPRRPLPVQDTTRRLVLVSRHHRLQLRDHTLITNAHSPQMSQSEVESSRVSFSPPRWRTPFHLEGITCITSKNTTDLRRDITTYQLTWPQLSAEPELETSSLLVNADQSPRLLDSTSSESRSKELKVTLERPLSCSELIDERTRQWSKRDVNAYWIVLVLARGHRLILIQLTKYSEEY